MNGRFWWFSMAMVSVMAGCSADAEPEADVLASPIVHGRADRGRDPGVVALMLGNDGLCTATLIAPRAVLTARHCVSQLASESVDCASTGAQVVSERDPSSLVVVTGDSVASGHAAARGTRVLVPASNRICGSDVAVVLLDRAVTGIDPVPVDFTGNVHTGDDVIAVGFGRRTDTGSAGVRERRDAVPIVLVTAREIELGESTCSGDSGGPALGAHTGAVLGVVSRGGPGCVSSGARNIYTRVDAWATLIREGIRLGGGAGTSTPPASHTASPPPEAPADFGTHCASGDDCSSGYCLRASLTCTSTCDADAPCPSGYHCRSATGGVHVCAP